MRGWRKELRWARALPRWVRLLPGEAEGLTAGAGGGAWLLERRFSLLFEFDLEVEIILNLSLFVARASLPQRARVTRGYTICTTSPVVGASHCTWWVLMFT